MGQFPSEAIQSVTLNNYTQISAYPIYWSFVGVFKYMNLKAPAHDKDTESLKCFNLNENDCSFLPR